MNQIDTLTICNAINRETDLDQLLLILDAAIGAVSKLEFTSESAEHDRQWAVNKLADAYTELEHAANKESPVFGPDEMTLAKWAAEARAA
jgi:hypothetical protein